MLILLQRGETLIMAAFPGSSLKVRVRFDGVLLSGGAAAVRSFVVVRSSVFRRAGESFYNLVFLLRLKKTSLVFLVCG